MTAATLWILERLFPSVYRLPELPTELPVEPIGDLEELGLKPNAQVYEETVAASEKLIALVLTSLWALRKKMIDPSTTQPYAEMRRLYATVRRTWEKIEDDGVRVIDYENTPFDDGLTMDVLAWEPREGVKEEYVLETTRPALAWNGRRIQQAQVIVATPLQSNKQ